MIFNNIDDFDDIESFEDDFRELDRLSEAVRASLSDVKIKDE